MPKIDRGKEKQRLVFLYAAMSDLELQKLGDNPESLTDWAFEALEAEMENRNRDWAGTGMPLPSQMVTSKPAEDLGKSAGRAAPV